MAKMVDPKTYARNVLKSAGYITTATIKGVDPTLTSYVKDTASAAKDMYHQVRDYKSTIRNRINGVLGETGYEDLRKIKGNVLEDLRTGKFYNPEREEKNNNEMLKSMGLSFDFDDMDFDVDENYGEKSAAAEVKESTETTNGLVGMLNNVTKVQKGTTIASTTSLLKGGRANTAAMMAHNEKMFNQVNNSLAVINSSIMNLHKDLTVPLNTHIINSTNFYQSMTNEVSGMHAELQNIRQLLSDRFAPTGKNATKSSSTNTWKAVMGSGLPNFGAWGRHAKNKLFSDTGMDMLSGFDPEMIHMLLNSGEMASPIALILSSIGSGAIRKSSWGRGLNKTVGTLKGGFNHMMVKISQYARKHSGDFTLPAILANLFDIMPNNKGKMDFSKYNHGRQDWTGEDSKALKEVIPTQLAQILSALTGEAPKLYDYKSGRWMTNKQLTADFNSRRNKAIGSSASELRNEVIQEFIEQDRKATAGTGVAALTTNSKAVRNLSATYDTLISMLSIKNKNITDFKNTNDLVSFCRRNRWLSTSATGNIDFIFDEKSIRRLAKILFSGSVAGARGKFEGAVVSGQITNASMIDEAADSTYGILHNGSGLNDPKRRNVIANIFESKDKYGKDVYWYLRNYYEQLQIITNRESAHIGTGNRANTYTDRPTSSASRNNERVHTFRNREIRPRSLTPGKRYKFKSQSEDVDADDRLVYNSNTGRYEAPRASIIGPTSANTRVNQEKNSTVDRLFGKLNGFLDDLFYGTSDAGIRASIKNHGGLIGAIKDIPSTLKDVAEDMSKKFTEWIKGKWTGFKNSEYGKKYFREMKNSVKGFFSDTWGDAKDKAARAYSFMSGRKAPWAAEMSGSRRGGIVRKSGMASVSEGEVIIPADKNPFYTGHMGNAARDSIERTNYNRWKKDGGDEDEFFGFFRKGGKVASGSWSKITNKQKSKIQEMYSNGETVETIAKEVKLPIAQVNNYIKSLDVKGFAGRVKEDATDTIKNSKAYHSAKNLLDNAIKKISDGADTLFGDSKLLNDGKKYAKEVGKVAKANLPKTLSSATLGGLVGAAITGSGIGLLGGMVIGAGTHIIKNSDMISNALFGTEDANGDYNGGLLPNKVVKFIKKKLPKVGKSAAIGGVLGTLGLAPGGIFGGMAIGAGLELVSSTNAFKDIMFGKEDVNGERNGGLMGSIRDHVVNPLINFTKNGLQHIGNYVKENMLNPLGKIFDPMKDWVKGKSKSILNKIMDSAKETVKRTIGERFNAILKPVAERAGKIGKGALKLAGNVVSAPFKAVGKAADSLERHNIRKGYSSKSAAERMKLEGQKFGLLGRKFKNTGYTKWANNASDEDVIAASFYTNGKSELKKNIIGQRQNLADTITASMRNGGNLDPKLVKDMKRLFNTDKVRKDNDFSDIISMVNSLDESVMGSETKKKVLERINASRGSIQKDIDKRKTFDADQEAFFNRIGLTDAKSRAKFIKEGRIQSQYDAAGIRKKTGLADIDAINAAKDKDNAAKLLKEQEKASPIDMKRNSLLETLVSFVSGIAKKVGVSNNDLPKDSNNGFKSSGTNGLNIPKPSIGKSDGEADEGETKTEFLNGKPVQYIYHNKQWNANMTDASTKEAMDESKEDRATKNKFYNAFLTGGFFNSLKDLFGGNKDDEKKSSIFDKIGGFFSNLFGGGEGGFNIGSLVKKFLPGALSFLGTGIVLNQLGKKAAGTSTDSGMYKGADAEARKQEVAGWKGPFGWLKKASLGMDSLENTARKRDTTTYNEDDYVSTYMSDRIGTRMGKNVLLGMNPKMAKAAVNVTNKTIGKIPLAGKGLAGTLNLSTKFSENFNKLANGVKSVPNKILDIATDPTKNGTLSQKLATGIYETGGKIASKTKGRATKIFSAIKDSKLANSKVGKVAVDVVSKIKSVVSNVINGIASKLGLKASGEAIDEASGAIAEQVAKKGGTKLASFMAKAVVVLQIVFIANAIISGFQDSKAKTILGILDKPTMGQKILSAALNGLNEAIPGIGGIIPTDVLFTIVYTALSALGCKFGKLAEQRAEAKATVEAYNKENGTTYNVEEYIHNVLGEYTWQERISNGVKNGWKSLKNTVKSGWDKFTGWITGKNDDSTGSGSGEDPNSGTNYSNSIISNGTLNSNYTKLTGGASSTNSTTNKTSGGFFQRLFGKKNGSVGSGSGNVHTTQKGNMRIFAGSTIDQNGCGPASAASVLRSYGKNVSVNDAASYAEAGGYVAGASGVPTSSRGGTKASYFEDILAKNGIQTSYTNNQSQIKSAVKSGSPTILLGQDKGNSSKSNSPFGPNPHYVVARGTDRKGNVLVDDPELNKPALYKRDILNKAKLGIATAGDSGLDETTSDSESSSSGATGVSGLLTTAFSGIAKSVGEKLGSDSKAGKVWNLLFGGLTGDSSTADSSDGSSGDVSSSGAGTVTYGANKLFTIATSTPGTHDPNIKCFNNASNGGVSHCVNGSPTDKVCNVLHNCVGWAAGRFNQIYNILSKTPNQMKFQLACNAEDFIEKARSMGLSVGSEPQVGAIMVWQKGNYGNSGDGAGHVAIVERVDSADTVYTSESGWRDSEKLRNRTRHKGNGNWGSNNPYKFRGFIYNPAVTAKTGGGDVPKISATESKNKIWKFLRRKGLSEYATAGAMGCWQSESSNRADRVEGDYLKSYPGSSSVLASKKSISDYTQNKLFKIYANNNPPININKAGYKGSDGYYYPGIGLAQWTGPRAQKLIDYGSQTGQNFRDVNTQLNYFWSEFQNRNGLKDKLNSATNPQDAATTFLDGFEMSEGWHNSSATGRKQNTERRANAQSIYNSYKGTDVSVEAAKHVPVIGSGSGLNTYDFTNPANNMSSIGSGSGTRVVSRSSKSAPVSNDANSDAVLKLLTTIAKNTSYLELLKSLVEIEKDHLDVSSQLNSSKSSSSTNASEDFSKTIEDSITQMKAKLDNISQAL